MKNNCFRKNASVKAGAHVSRLLRLRLAMTVVLLSPVVLSAQPGVTITGLAVEAGTVTFDVRWEPLTPPVVWSDTVWVFVDYNDNGTMKRLPLTGATLTNPSAAATATVPLPNNKGAWVAGNARSVGSFSAKVKLYYDSQTAVAGACAYASNYPPVAEYNISVNNVSVSFTGTPPYDLVVNTGSGTASAQAYSTYNLFAGQTLASFTDKTGAPGIIKPGYNQPQGGCTFTQPAVVGTFADFHNTSVYSSSTYVTLTDERDNKNYTVVKIGTRWIMAQNLNYQTGLTWRSASNSPSTVTGSNKALIGSFWCPGGFSTETTTSTLASCDVWGALYSWETAMMLDGKGTWTETDGGGYCTGAANTDACKRNWGRSASTVRPSEVVVFARRIGMYLRSTSGVSSWMAWKVAVVLRIKTRAVLVLLALMLDLVVSRCVLVRVVPSMIVVSMIRMRIGIIMKIL